MPSGAANVRGVKGLSSEYAICFYSSVPIHMKQTVAHQLCIQRGRFELSPGYNLLNLNFPNCLSLTHIERQSSKTHIDSNTGPAQNVQYHKPDTDIPSLSGHGSLRGAQKFVGINADLHNIVDNGEERSQRKGSHEEGHEPELED